MTLDRDTFLTAVTASGRLPAAYAEDVLVRLAHHSSAIEGNTLTISDTVTLLVDELLPRGGVSVREYHEVANHRAAVVRIVCAVDADERLTDRLVRELHALLLDHLLHDRGEYKQSSNAVVGASWQPLAPHRVPETMRHWADQSDWQLRHLKGVNRLEAIARSHIEFERIHPFSDGNGRVGRAVLVLQTMQAYGVPAIVRESNRSDYLRLLDTADASGFAELLSSNLTAETARAAQFSVPGFTAEDR